MKQRKIKYLKASNILCFGTKGIELNFENLGNIVLIKGKNLDAVDDENDAKDASNGAGKCHGINTPILMFDGSIKLVQDIIVGDLVMGDNSTPRKVLELHRGSDNLYEIVPKKGDSFVVNESHILVLKIANYLRKNAYNFCKSEDDYYKISVKDYLKQSNHFKNLMKLCRKEVNFSHKKAKIDPYILGLWLGDGHKNNSGLTNCDKAVIESWLNEAKLRNLKVTRHNTKFSYFIVSQRRNIDINSLLMDLKYYNLLYNKHIPNDYKMNSRKNRLQLLAGILDTDGHLDKSGFEFVNKNERLANDVVFLARSLGFAAYINKCIKKCQTGAEGEYYRVYISGDCSKIPTRINYKKSPKRKINKDVLNVGFTVKPLGKGDYYGFTVDGNNLYLLGDFTVSHNSTVADIIAYVLYGKTIKKSKKFNQADIIHNQADKLYAEIIIDDYRIVRTRKVRKNSDSGTVDIWHSPEGIWNDETKITQVKKGTIQDKIERDIIGLNYETFVNIFVFGDDNSSSFLECDTPTKREIVENLLSLERYRNYHTNAKDYVKETKIGRAHV